MNGHYYGVIMAGGIGSRFWPISRKALPKQFLDFTDNGSTFLRHTYDRMSLVVPEENIFVITLDRYKDLVLRDIPEISHANVLCEPYNRNTAPCIAYAAHEILSRDSEAVMAVSPSDHAVKDMGGFKTTLEGALGYAMEHRELITIGVIPQCPDSNYGYIQVDGDMDAIKSGNPMKVKTFTEKPDKEIAEVFLQSGEFLWNTGIFAWRADVIMEELVKLAPEIGVPWRESLSVEGIYASITRNSIDYAVLEKTDRAVVIPAQFDWADIGNWESFYGYMSKRDADGNATMIKGKKLIRGVKGSMLISTNPGKLVAIEGMEDMIIVDTGDILMICPRDDSRIKEILSELALPDYEEFR